jgi:hypothetical protein
MGRGMAEVQDVGRGVLPVAIPIRKMIEALLKT